MNTATAAPESPATASARNVVGWPLFRYVLKIGRRVRSLERFAADQATAEQDARHVAAEWAEGRQHAVLQCYPVPTGTSAHGGLCVGGP